jgi:hypothetical protein
MAGFTLLFSVCAELVFKRKDIIDYLRGSVPGIRTISIELSDTDFTMSVRVTRHEQGLIESRLIKKGLHVKLLHLIAEV